MLASKDTRAQRPISPRLEVSVEEEGGFVLGRLIAVSDSHASVRFLHSSHPLLPLAEEVELRFAWHPGPTLPSLVARVIQRWEEPGATCYRLTYTPPPEFLDALPEAVRSVFDRRYATRVAPEGELRCVVDQLGRFDSPSFDGRVVNLSELGLGLAIPVEADRFCTRRPSLRCRFSLEVGNEFELRGDIRHRRVLGGSALYGVELDARATPDWLDQSGRLKDYIRARSQRV